jgi:hypothetical protein
MSGRVAGLTVGRRTNDGDTAESLDAIVIGVRRQFPRRSG